MKSITDISPETPVTLKESGNILEIRVMAANHGLQIRKLDKDHGIDLRTGEIIEYQHNANRSENKGSVSQSLRKLRDLINSNLTDPSTALWVTLTYAENMTNPKQLYQDYRRFWQRFKYYLAKEGHPEPEFIAAAEPQARGAWHMHCLFLFPEKAPFIPNETMAKIWRNGFTTTKSLRGVDNPGLYLTAYLGDMELTEAEEAGIEKGFRKEVTALNAGNKRVKKSVIKGARLHLYPSGFNLYRHSHGIKYSIVTNTTEAEAQAIVSSSPLIYEKKYLVNDNVGDIKNVIYYRQYNRARRKDNGR